MAPSRSSSSPEGTHDHDRHRPGRTLLSQDWRTSSLWAASLTGDGYPALTEARSVDVVVIGAGIAGMLVATLAARDGATVLVLARHGVGGVATRNTTAKI